MTVASDKIAKRRAEAIASPGRLSGDSANNRSFLLIAGVSAIALLGSGCASTSHSAHPPGGQGSSGSPTVTGMGTTGAVPSGAPTTLRDCGKAADPGSPDGGVVAGLDWPTGERALRTPSQAYICIGSFAGSTVTLVPTGGQLSVQPGQFTVPVGGGVLPVSITALASGSVTLWLRVVSPAGKRQLDREVAVVVADSQRWHFERAG